MNSLSILTDFGKNIADDNAMEKIYQISDLYNLDLSKLSSMLLAFLISKNIDDDSITMEIVDNFEKEKLISQSENQLLKNAAKTHLLKNEKTKILLERNFDVLEQYGVEINDDLEIESNFVTEHSFEETRETLICNKMEIDESSDNKSFIVPWSVSLAARDCDDDNNSTYQYMYQTSTKIQQVFEKLGLDLFRKRLLNINDSTHINMSDLSPVDVINQEVYICGTIIIDHINALITNDVDEDFKENEIISKINTKLNLDNIALCGLSSIKSAVVPLNIEQLSSYSFFPGQSVIIKGHNPSKKSFVVQEILANHVNSSLPISSADVIGDLRVLIASGPFSMQNSDDDSVFKQLMKTMKEEHCDVLVLIGPFVDANNEAIETKCEDELYSTMLTKKLLLIINLCIEINVHVVFVPSTDDLGHEDSIYPQQSYSSFFDDKQQFCHPLVHFTSNPGFFAIGPFHFGISSADILRHLSLQEINKNHTKGIKRLCQHILDENNFYPLKPSNPQLSVDWTLWPKCHFGANPPHCLILPSLLSNFQEDVSGVLCLNPGRITSRGTFCVLTLSASRIRDQTTSIVSAASCQFVRI